MEKMKTAVSGLLERKLGYKKQSDGIFSSEIYADYRDKMSNRDANSILLFKRPSEVFWEKLDEWYRDCELTLRGELEDDLRTALTAEDGPYPKGFTPKEESVFSDLLLEMVHFDLPVKHYLKQSFHVNILVDTGDGNYAFIMNSVYPAWCGQYDEPISDRASIVWLAKSQGYTKTQLRKALRLGDMTQPHGFLKSMRTEVANITSHMNVLAFLVELTLEELIELNRLIHLQARNGFFYDTRKNPYCGYITLDKDTKTGLFDLWNGSGSCFEIELERDVKLPIKYIRSARPDGGDGYSVDTIYGMCGSAWQHGGVKQIHAPKKFAA